jgi:hypothetical protein
MKIKITSHRGHHEAVLEADVSQMIFEKLTGVRTEALPCDLKTRMPQEFKELKALWTSGKTAYLAIEPSANRHIREFDPNAEEILFLAPITGG